MRGRERERRREFERLKEEWYEKLRASGFNDIEYETRTDARHAYSSHSLKQSFGSRRQRNITGTVFRATGEYYRLAERFCHHHTFRHELERECFRLFAEGKSYREIAAEVSRHHTRVYQILRRVLDGPFDRYLKTETSEELDLCF